MTKKKAKLRIRKVLDQYKVSQYELAKRMGLQTQHVTKMIKDGYNPQFETLLRIADAIGCKVTELIED
jgi:transcriptional regulator with XRE-family HTH domain